VGHDVAGSVPLTWTAVELAKDDFATNSSNSIAFHDKTGSNQDACKGATVTIHYLAS
jgi:hypothetical protein